MFLGMRIVSCPDMVDQVEDWSRVRSHGRARRRRRLGYRQNIVVRAVPRQEVLKLGEVMYAHPVLIDALKRQMTAQMTAQFDRRMENALYGRGF